MLAKIFKSLLKKLRNLVLGDYRSKRLSNIIVDGENMYMVDWDNVGIYPTVQIYEKLKSDLQSAFGDLFDPSSI